MATNCSSVRPVLTFHSLIQWCRRPRARRVFASASASGPAPGPDRTRRDTAGSSLRRRHRTANAFQRSEKKPPSLSLPTIRLARPVEELDAEALAVALLIGRGKFQGACHREHRAGAAFALRAAREAPLLEGGAQVNGSRESCALLTEAAPGRETLPRSLEGGRSIPARTRRRSGGGLRAPRHHDRSAAGSQRAGTCEASVQELTARHLAVLRAVESRWRRAASQL